MLLTLSSLGRTQTVTPSASDSALSLRLAHALDSLAKGGRFSGTVLLAHHDVPIFSGSYGLADRSSHTWNTVETAYNLASVGKLFTGTAIQQLAHAGTLQLDSTVGHDWPDYPNGDVARKVTIGLVAMTSGIGGDIFDPRFVQTSDRSRAIRGLLLSASWTFGKPDKEKDTIDLSGDNSK